MTIRIAGATQRALCAFLCAASILALASCASTTLVAEWKDEKYAGGRLNKIVVIGLFQSLRDRRAFEDEITQAIRKSGTASVKGLDIMAPDMQYRYEELESKFDKLGIDGILLVKVASARSRERYVPGSYRDIPAPDFNPYSGSYYAFYRSVYDPGYLQVTDVFMIDTTLYSNATDRLIWMGETKSVEENTRSDEPVNAPVIARVVAKLIVDGMRRNGLIR